MLDGWDDEPFEPAAAAVGGGADGDDSDVSQPLMEPIVSVVPNPSNHQRVHVGEVVQSEDVSVAPMLLLLRTKLGPRFGTLIYWSMIFSVALIFCGVVALDIYTWVLWSGARSSSCEMGLTNWILAVCIYWLFVSLLFPSRYIQHMTRQWTCTRFIATALNTALSGVIPVMSVALVLMAAISIFHIDEKKQSCMPTLYAFAWQYVIVHAAVYSFILAMVCCWIFSYNMETPWLVPRDAPRPRPRPRYHP